MQTPWAFKVVTFLKSIHHKFVFITVTQFLDKGFKALILDLDFQSCKSLIEALYCLLLIYIAFDEAGKEIVIHLWTNELSSNLKNMLWTRIWQDLIIDRNTKKLHWGSLKSH